MTTRPHTARSNRCDVHAAVTQSIIAQLEKGVRPWAKPWAQEAGESSLARPVRHNGEAYRGINVLMLWMAGQEAGFTSPYWLTFKQAVELRAHVRKGEHGSMVVYADRLTRTGTTPQGEAIEEEIPYLKVYTVFNAQQVEGLPARFASLPSVRLSKAERVENAERFVATTTAQVRHGGSSAHYSPGLDQIQMPRFEAFDDAHGYYATLLHELTHWTGHKGRLGREFSAGGFGDAAYAREELVAEIGAAFLCCDLGVELEPREDHAAYLSHWLTVLREDKRAIFRAAAHAQRACDFLHLLQSPRVAAA